MLTVYGAQLEYGEPPDDYNLRIEFGLFATQALACSAVETALRVPRKLTFVPDEECPGLWTVDLPEDAGLVWLPLREDYKGPSIASIWEKEVWEDLESFKPWWSPPETEEGTR